jgi:hypothetical protein
MTQEQIAQSARDEANHREDYRRIKNDQVRVEHCGSAVLTEVDDGVVTVQHWLTVRPGRNRMNVRASEKFIPGMGLVLQADEDTLDDQKTVLYRRKSRRVVDDPTDTFFTFAFSIGNKFEQPSKLNMARSKRSGQRRIWQFFIAASGRYDCRQFIEKVVIELPGKDSARSLTLSHPFEFSATTEISEIPYEIYWRPWTRHPRTRGMHQMGFGKNGCCENVETSFIVKAFQDFLRNSLSENLK